ncbi:hypothetical protein [Ferrovibrio sp.]|jgi:hypothetical protein|uniref:hypothetical protein n=1 Tax=Ferrovibrio sp. TaxID=1917215 RepID=UPI002610AE69|nr:hypothetical protein [Ferrovibrio sp.]
MDLFNVVVGVANIVGAIAGIAGALFALIAILPKARYASSRSGRQPVPVEMVGAAQPEYAGTPHNQSGFGGAMGFLFQEEWQRAKIRFWGDHWSDEEVYLNFKRSIAMGACNFFIVLMQSFASFNAKGFGLVLAGLAFLVLCLGLVIVYYGYARFKRRFG